jgi:hypothetical protein
VNKYHSLFSLLFHFLLQSILTTLIYLTLTAINLVLPLVWIVGFLYLSIIFSGFPFSSPEARARLNVLVRLGGIWTLARLGWGLIALTSVMQGWLISAKDSVHFYSFILVNYLLHLYSLILSFLFQFLLGSM